MRFLSENEKMNSLILISILFVTEVSTKNLKGLIPDQCYGVDIKECTQEIRENRKDWTIDPKCKRKLTAAIIHLSGFCDEIIRYLKEDPKLCSEIPSENCKIAIKKLREINN
ncbi:MAG: hypothetical protein MHPSP_000896 [Paramarteilia canceri]